VFEADAVACDTPIAVVEAAVLLGATKSDDVTLKHGTRVVKRAASTNVMSEHAKNDSFLLLSFAQYSNWIVAFEPAATVLATLGIP
jgi:hypothetical protein